MPAPLPTPSETPLEARYQDLVAQYYLAQVQFCQSQRACTHLQTVVRIKQAVIEELLSYYPHPITPELQAKLALA